MWQTRCDRMAPFFIVLAILGAAGALPVAHAIWRRHALRRPTTEEILEEMDRTFRAALPGAPPLAKILAARTSRSPKKLLFEALQSMRNHEYRASIGRLLTVYDMQMAPRARAALHLLAGNAFFFLSELDQALVHYRDGLAAANEAGDRSLRATLHT